MKGKLIYDNDFYPENEMPFGLLRNKEYLILGITGHGYIIYNELGDINFATPIDRIEITDQTKPDFWRIDETDDQHLVPEEWHWQNFLSLNGEPVLELWDYEIWSVTQFAKGLLKYDLPKFPSNLKRALDVQYKLDIINAYFKIASEYDYLKSYEFAKYEIIDFSRREFYSQIPAEKSLIVDCIDGFSAISSILNQIGQPLEYSLKLKSYEFENIRKIILFSIWALFGTKDFDVFKISFVEEMRNNGINYLLKKDTKAFLLSFDYSH